jgi:RNA polymerase sigma factor (sigma-70 family)
VPATQAIPEEDNSDNQLMCRVKYSDDCSAFQEVLQRTSNSINGVLRRLLPPNQKEDAYSEVALRIWKYRQLFREDKGTVRGWAAAMARNYSRDWWRRHKATFRSLDNVGIALPDNRCTSPAVVAEQADWLVYIRRRCSEILVTFPPWVQRSWHLRIEQCLPFREVSRQVDRPLGTVASALFRAQKKVLTLLKYNESPLGGRRRRFCGCAAARPIPQHKTAGTAMDSPPGSRQ